MFRRRFPPRLRRCFTPPALEASTGATPARTAICGTPNPGRGHSEFGDQPSGNDRLDASDLQYWEEVVSDGLGGYPGRVACKAGRSPPRVDC
jgi:hypothetical protein